MPAPSAANSKYRSTPRELDMPAWSRISPREISRLSPDAFQEFINELIWAEARTLGVPVNGIGVTDLLNVSDGGIDASVHALTGKRPWFPAGESIWQYKAYANTAKVKFEEELAKELVQQALERGATYVLVCQEDFAHTKLAKIQAKLASAAAGRPTLLLPAHRLAEWAADHPRVQLLFRPPLGRLCTVATAFQEPPLVDTPYVADDQRDAIAQQIRNCLFDFGAPAFLLLTGTTGIGKTRLTLESVRDAGDQVLYLPAGPLPEDMLSWISGRPTSIATLVVDERHQSEDDIAWLRKWVSRCSGRLRVVAIQAVQHVSNGPDIYPLSPLDTSHIESILEHGWPTLPYEVRRWIADGTQGLVRLAVIIANNCAHSPELAQIGQLCRLYEVRGMLDALIPDGPARQALTVVSLLSRVGWEDEQKDEGRIVTEFVAGPGQYNVVRGSIASLQQTGLATTSGRFAYATPDLIANYLAAEFWSNRPRHIHELWALLPSERSRDRLIERLTALRGEPQVAAIVVDLIGKRGPFLDLDSIDDDHSSRFLLSLAQSFPQEVLQILERILQKASSADLRDFRAGRRNIIWALEALCWRREQFARAARLVLRLALAENEPYANNATGTWTALFKTHLGATEAPAADRVALVSAVLSSPDPASRLLAVTAIRPALFVEEIGQSLASDRGAPAPPRWRPQTDEDDLDYRHSLLALLDRATSDGASSVRLEALSVLRESAGSLVAIGLSEETINRLVRLQPENDDERRALWDAMVALTRYERDYLTDDQAARLEAAAAALHGSSYHDRLRRYVGRWAMLEHDPDERTEEKTDPIAAEVLAHPQLLAPELAWLLSGDADHVYPFARRLGALDQRLALLPEIDAATSNQSSDARLLSGYLHGAAEHHSAEWLDELLDTWARSDSHSRLAFDASWRGQQSDRAAERILELAQRGAIPAVNLGVFTYGGWSPALTEQRLYVALDLLQRDAAPTAVEIALQLLDIWADAHQRTIPDSCQPFAWQFVCRTVPSAGRPMFDYWWRHIAGIVLPADPRRVAEAILARLAGESLVTRGEISVLLKRTLRLAPAAVWPALAQVWENGGVPALRLSSWARDVAALDDLDPDLLLSWIAGSAERASTIAEMVKPRDPLQPVILALLSQFGAQSLVARILARNASTGFIAGSPVARTEALIATTRRWQASLEPSVAEWAGLVIAHLRAELESFTRFEEESDLPYL